MSRAAAFALLLNPLVAGEPAHAEVTRTNVLIAARAIGFIAKIDGGYSSLGWWLWRLITKTFHFTL